MIWIDSIHSESEKLWCFYFHAVDSGNAIRYTTVLHTRTCVPYHSPRNIFLVVKIKKTKYSIMHLKIMVSIMNASYCRRAPNDDGTLRWYYHFLLFFIHNCLYQRKDYLGDILIVVVHSHISYLSRQIIFNLCCTRLPLHTTRFSPNTTTFHHLLGVCKGKEKIQMLRRLLR